MTLQDLIADAADEGLECAAGIQLTAATALALAAAIRARGQA